ncbi:deoxyribodipyrimidine photolyase [Rhodobacteraceae bacterium R_SAG7]|nr:deoxyribodipyrimidine photolyase [Rhodobacteraceae bacterium R_SAG7]
MATQEPQIGPATRAEALLRMEAFTPRMGLNYATFRNHDYGPQRQSAVSMLSPYLRRRLLTEPEVIAAALAAHGPQEADKFVQEVLWRSYFKGWMERRPEVWANYITGRDADFVALEEDPGLAIRVNAAETGETGLAYFDTWAKELVRTGYLHNHARMWFASIWIFTLKLPWRLGADFFLRHLLDGDPASNTCSWRWVAGLHTRGKPYVAQASNIARFSGGRFAPQESELATEVTGLMDEEPDGLPHVKPLRSVLSPEAAKPSAVLLTEEDCTPASADLASLDIRGAARLYCSHLRSPRRVAAAVSTFEEDALADTVARIGLDAQPWAASEPEALADWVQSIGAQQIVMPYATVGPLGDWIARALPLLRARGVAVAEWQRDWDGLVWPHATAGFFKVKKRLPDILTKAGLT